MTSVITEENNKINQQLQAGSISITYFTDPLCCWSWAFEPEWQKLLATFNPLIKWRCCMGGLLPDWNNYHDAVNSISKPLQMGPMWLHAAELTGAKLRDDIWAKDPPASSYPACIAVKAATLQSEDAGAKYLYLVRKAVMQHGLNIAKHSVLLDVAMLLAENKNIVFDVNTFKQDLVSNTSREAFRKDLQEVKYYGINRFPSLVIRYDSANARLVTGYQKFETVEQVILQLINAAS